MKASIRKITFTSIILSQCYTFTAAAGGLTVVFDPSNFAQNSIIADNSVKEVANSLNLLKQAKEQFELIKQQAKKLSSLGTFINSFKDLLNNSNKKSNSYDSYVAKNKEYIKKGYSYNDYLSSSCIAQGNCTTEQARAELARKGELLNVITLANKDLITNTPIYNKQITDSETLLKDLNIAAKTTSSDTGNLQLSNQLLNLIAAQTLLNNKILLEQEKYEQAKAQLELDELAQRKAATKAMLDIEYKKSTPIPWTFKPK